MLSDDEYIADKNSEDERQHGFRFRHTADSLFRNAIHGASGEQPFYRKNPVGYFRSAKSSLFAFFKGMDKKKVKSESDGDFQHFFHITSSI